MDRRQRRSGDRRTALHLFLESLLAKLDARSMRLTRGDDILAGVGDDAYADEWRPTWMLPVTEDLFLASSGGRPNLEIAPSVRRILTGR